MKYTIKLDSAEGLGSIITILASLDIDFEIAANEEKPMPAVVKSKQKLPFAECKATRKGWDIIDNTDWTEAFDG